MMCAENGPPVVVDIGDIWIARVEKRDPVAVPCCIIAVVFVHYSFDIERIALINQRNKSERAI